MKSFGPSIRRYLTVATLAAFFFLIISCQNDEEGATLITTTPTVASIYPTDGAKRVSLSTSILVTFSQAMDSYEIKTNLVGDSCYGHIQVSADDFVTCVRMIEQPSNSNNSKTFSLKPYSDLAALTNYKIKVSELDATYTYTTNDGFTTGDSTIPTIASIDPADGTTDVPPDTSIVVNFSESMDPSTIIINTVDTGCSGTIQLSADEFSNCIMMSADPIISDFAKTFTLKPASNLSWATTHKIKVIEAAEDAFGGNTLVADYATATGFTTYETAFTVGAISGNTTEAGGAATFTFKLKIRPRAEVAIPVSITDITEGTVSTSSLTFSSSNWNVNQTVIVTGVDDSLIDGDQTYTITLASAISDDSSYNGLDPDDIVLKNLNDDFDKIPDTGQTTSFTSTFGEDHDYTINSPSYTDNGDNTITDVNTGLLWEKKTDNNKADSYTWGQANTYCSNLNLAGQDPDWRLPSVRELMRIIDYETTNTLKINSIFANNFTNSYHSSTTYKTSSDIFMVVQFFYGSTYYDSSSQRAVRCVRGNSYTQLYSDIGDGTINDFITGLVWEKAKENPMTWESALAYCANLNLANQTDWRLPNIKELESIIEYSKTYPTINTTYFEIDDDTHYWSSTTYIDLSTQVFRVDFYDGFVRFGPKSDSNHVRCVRGGQ